MCAKLCQFPTKLHGLKVGADTLAGPPRPRLVRQRGEVIVVQRAPHVLGRLVKWLNRRHKTQHFRRALQQVVGLVQTDTEAQPIPLSNKLEKLGKEKKNKQTEKKEVILAMSQFSLHKHFCECIGQPHHLSPCPSLLASCPLPSAQAMGYAGSCPGQQTTSASPGVVGAVLSIW